MKKATVLKLGLEKSGITAGIQTSICKLTGLRKYHLPDGRSYTSKKAALKEAEDFFKSQGFK